MTKQHVDQQAAEYMPTRGKIDDPLRTGADSILRAVEKGGAIQPDTLREMIDLLEDDRQRARRQGDDPQAQGEEVVTLGYCCRGCDVGRPCEHTGRVYARTLSKRSGPSSAELTADTITDAQIRAGYRDGLISYDLLEFATFPAWTATRPYYRERCAEILSGSSRGAHEPVPDAAARVRRDQQHGLLPEHECDLGREDLCPPKDLAAAALVRAHDHLDRVPVLAPSLPDSSRLEEGRALELALDEGLEHVAEHRSVERHWKSPVATDLAGDAGADVEAHGAGGTDGHESSIPAKAEASKDVLERRAGRVAHRFYLYFEIERSTGQISIETSWLPDLPEVDEALTPLGFCRKADGSYRASLPDADDHVGVLRKATKALALLIGEATL